MTEHEGDISNSQNHDKKEGSKKQESSSKDKKSIEGLYEDLIDRRKKQELEDAKVGKGQGEQEEESKKEKKAANEGGRSKDIIRILVDLISSPGQNTETLQHNLNSAKKEYSKKEISQKQFKHLEKLVKDRLSQLRKEKINSQKQFHEEITPKDIPRKDLGIEKRKVEEKSTRERKAQTETPKDRERGESAYQKLTREISKVHEGRYYSKNDAERIEAERQIKELEVKREEYIRRARAGGWLDERVSKGVENVREAATRGKMFFSDLIRESRALIVDPEGIPTELQGVNKDYYQKEVLKIIGEKSTPTDKKQQRERLREYLKILRTIRLAPQSIANNPIWNEMISAIAYFDPELQKEFKARLEVFQYALNFKENAEGVETGIAGSSRVRLSHIGRVLKVPEIQRAHDLLEENSQVNVVEIIESDKRSNKSGLERKIRAGEEIGVRNPLYAGSEAQRKVALDNIALDLAESFGEKTERLNDEERANLAEKYMWAVDEAEDVWRITARADETDINMKGKGGQFWLNRLFHFDARLKDKKFGYKSTRKYFIKPLLPIWVEGEPILPVLKGEELEISGDDIDMFRERFRIKGLKEEKIEKRIRMIKGMLLKGRGLMMKGFWEYQIDFLLKKEAWLEIEGEGQEGNGLQKIGFKKEDVVRYTRDGNGRELPYRVYKKEFISPSGEKKEMVVRASVDKEDKGKDIGVINIENPSAEILSEICQQVPEGFYGSYVGDWIIKAENTRKLLESGALKFPPGSEKDMERLLLELRSKNLFDYLDPLAKDKGERKPGKYYQEDAWEDLIRGSIDFGLHEGRKVFEPWKMWGAWRAGLLTKKATDLKVITEYQGRRIENEMLTFLGMKGNVPRWLRCNFDRFTMFYRWGPGRMMILSEMLKEFFQGILPELPSSPKKK